MYLFQIQVARIPFASAIAPRLYVATRRLSNITPPPLSSKEKVLVTIHDKLRSPEISSKEADLLKNMVSQLYPIGQSRTPREIELLSNILRRIQQYKQGPFGILYQQEGKGRKR